MNSSANVPATHKVRKGIAAVIINAVLLIFSLFCILHLARRLSKVWYQELLKADLPQILLFIN